MNLDKIKATLAATTPRLEVKEYDFYFDEIGRIVHELVCWPAESAKAQSDHDLFRNSPTWLAALVARVEELEDAAKAVCRACRFWSPPTTPGFGGQCERPSYPRALVSGGDDGIYTLAEFGCIQFETSQAEGVG
jgi:hypothetical protein